MDPRLDRLFESLEAQLGAEIERAEEVAADDLALSLRQDRSLQDVLAQGPCTALTTGGPREVCEVAKDHVRLNPGIELVPISAALFEKGTGTRPKRSDHTLVEVLRAEVRRGTHISIEVAEHKHVEGRLLACGEEHVALSARGRELVLALAQIRLIKLSLEG